MLGWVVFGFVRFLLCSLSAVFVFGLGLGFF